MPNRRAGLKDALMKEELAQTAIIEKHYRIEAIEKVASFLNNDPEKSELLIEAHSQIETYFPGARPLMQLVSDPELGHRQLLLSIATKLDIEEAMDTLDGFRDAWWLDIFPAQRESSL